MGEMVYSTLGALSAMGKGQGLALQLRSLLSQWPKDSYHEDKVLGVPCHLRNKLGYQSESCMAQW